MKAPIFSRSRLARASSGVRALVGLLMLTMILLLKELLDVVWVHFHIDRFIADLIVQIAAAPIVTLFIAPMFRFLAPIFREEPSCKPKPNWPLATLSRWNSPFPSAILDGDDDFPSHYHHLPDPSWHDDT